MASTLFRSGLVATACLLHGCNSTFTADVVKRSVTEVALPIGGVRLPPVDTNSTAQLTLSLVRQDPSRSVRLQHGSGTKEFGIVDAGNASVSMSSFQVSGAASAWTGDRYRVGFPFDVGEKGGSFGIEAGSRWGRVASLEVFGGFGMASTRSKVDWSVETTTRNDGDPDTKSVREESVSYEQPNLYWNLGVHLGARRSGPWIEGVLLRQHLFQARTKRDPIWIDVSSASTGWAIGSPRGVVTVFVRGTSMDDRLEPSAGVQFTAAAKLPN